MNSTPPSIPDAQPKNSPLAIWSLVFGIMAIVLSIVCIGPLFAIPAVICGHMAHSRIKKSAGALSGDGLVLGGLITGYIGIALIPVIGMLVAIAVPNFVKARDTAQRNVCINNLRQIEGAKQAWSLENKKEPGDAVDESQINQSLEDGTRPVCAKGGTYIYGPVGTDPSCSAHGNISELEEMSAK